MSGYKQDELNAHDRLKQPQRFASEYHVPVLCKTVVKELITSADGIYVDATLGGGGHAAAILEKLSPVGRVVGIDRDDDALNEAESRLSREIKAGRFKARKGNYDELEAILLTLELSEIDGLLLDLGVSSHQLDTPERGFSHRFDASLDMRMNTEDALSAASIVNEWDEWGITMLLKKYGEEPRSRRIAKNIVANRPLSTTKELADLVRQSVPDSQASKALSRTFQAIRMAVNEELDALEKVLVSSSELLRPGGRVAVISYHSLEDRRVKRYFRSGNFQGDVQRDIFGKKLSPWREVTKKPIYPDEAEIAGNPRARSARLRIAERIAERNAGGGVEHL